MQQDKEQPGLSWESTIGVDRRDTPSLPLNKLLDGWWQRTMLSRGALPTRADFLPEAFPKMLPNLWLIDIDVSGADVEYQIRLWGTGCTRAIGIDCTGMKLNENNVELADAVLQKWFAIYEGVRRNQQPIHIATSPHDHNKDFIRVANSLYPLGDEAGAVAKIIGVFDYEAGQR